MRVFSNDSPEVSTRRDWFVERNEFELSVPLIQHENSQGRLMGASELDVMQMTAKSRSL